MRKILTYWVFFLGNALNAIHGKQMPHRSSFTQVRLCQNRRLKSTHGANRQHKSVLFGFIEQLNKRWRYHDVMRRFTRELISRTRYHPSEDYIMFEPILNKSIFLFGILSLHVLTTFYPILRTSSIQRTFQQYNRLALPHVASLKCQIDVFKQYVEKGKLKISALKMCFYLEFYIRFFSSFHFVYLSRGTWSW